jgi:predicted metal-dependent hydrolase
MSTTTIARNGTAKAAGWHDADELRWTARHWATRIGLKVPHIHLRQMSTKWASISMRGRLTLNTELLDLKKELGEYVIVHELVHLLAPNHGKVFKSFLHAYLPDWQVREEELKQECGRSSREDSDDD